LGAAGFADQLGDMPTFYAEAISNARVSLYVLVLLSFGMGYASS
jgi:hypothetical protein